MLEEQRESSCCGLLSRPKFTREQATDIATDIYTTATRQSTFSANQDLEFLTSIGITGPSLDDLTRLDGQEEVDVLKGLMTVLQREAPTNPEVAAFMEGKYPLPIDTDAALRALILSKVEVLRPSPAIEAEKPILSPDIEALRTMEGPAKRIGDRLAEVPDQLPHLFRTPENIATIKDLAAMVLIDPMGYTHACKKDLSDSALLESLTDENAARFVDVVDQLVAGCVTANTRILENFPDTTAITMTGSDIHHGHSVHIVKTAGDEKWVYKPRDIGVDKAVCGSHSTDATHQSLFDTLNTLGGGRIMLPTMDFMQHETHGYTQFVDSSAEQIMMTEQEANAYYRQLGQLVVACMAFGIADIHQDNIMAGVTVGADKKPYIIDAEVSLLPNKIRTTSSREIEFTTERHHGSRLANNAVISGEDLSALDKGLSLDDTKYMQAYADSFEQGAAELQTLLKQAGTIDTIATLIEAQKPHLHHIRLVPLATADFETTRSSLNPKNREAIETYLHEELSTSFTDSGIVIPAEMWPTISENLLTDLHRGNIPIMQYNGETNEVTYNTHVIGSYSDGDITPLVTIQLTRLATMPTADLMKLL
jgi:hypothetical protein